MTAGSDLTPLSDSELRALDEAAAGATPGSWQWHWRHEDQEAPGVVFSETFRGHAYAIAMCPRYRGDNWAPDATFIALAHPLTLRRLIAEVRELREAIRLAQIDVEQAQAFADQCRGVINARKDPTR